MAWNIRLWQFNQWYLEYQVMVIQVSLLWYGYINICIAVPKTGYTNL